MRKQESVHLHALLAKVATDLDDRPDVRSPDLTAYRDLGIRPAAVHRSKEDHEAAVLVLASAIERGIVDQPPLEV